MDVIVFVYAKEGKIKVVGLEEIKVIEKEILADGWKHVQTIDPCKWMEYLHNVCETVDLFDEVRTLSM